MQSIRRELAGTHLGPLASLVGRHQSPVLVPADRLASPLKTLLLGGESNQVLVNQGGECTHAAGRDPCRGLQLAVGLAQASSLDAGGKEPLRDGCQLLHHAVELGLTAAGVSRGRPVLHKQAVLPLHRHKPVRHLLEGGPGNRALELPSQLPDPAHRLALEPLQLLNACAGDGAQLAKLVLHLLLVPPQLRLDPLCSGLGAGQTCQLYLGQRQSPHRLGNLPLQMARGGG